MNRRFFTLFAALVLIPASGALAATFTAKAEEGVITVFSTSKKAELCSARVNFTYLENGERKSGFTSKAYFKTTPGKHVKEWEFRNPGIVAPLLTGDNDLHCGKDLPPEPKD